MPDAAQNASPNARPGETRVRASRTAVYVMPHQPMTLSLPNYRDSLSYRPAWASVHLEKAVRGFVMPSSDLDALIAACIEAELS